MEYAETGDSRFCIPYSCVTILVQKYGTTLAEVNTIAADALATQGARVSAAVAFIMCDKRVVVFPRGEISCMRN